MQTQPLLSVLAAERLWRVALVRWQGDPQNPTKIWGTEWPKQAVVWDVFSDDIFFKDHVGVRIGSQVKELYE
jgi:hypothetical protein